MKHDSEFGLQAVMFLLKMAADGDFDTLTGFGIRSDQINRLLALTAPKMSRLADMGRANFLTVTVDASALDIALDMSENDARRMDLIYRMLKAGASHPVMSALFGLTTSDVANYRRFLNLEPSSGRPSIPSDSDQEKLWEIFEQAGDLADMLPELLLQAHDETGLGIDRIWPLWTHWSTASTESNNLLPAGAAA